MVLRVSIIWLAVAASIPVARANSAGDIQLALANVDAVDEFPLESAAYRGRPLDESCGPLDDWSVFAGLEGSKQPQDFGVNAHFGARTSANYGRLLGGEHSIGVQIGTAVVATDNAVQVVERIEGTDSRLQSFTTLGLFQHTCDGWHWGAGYDLLYQDYYDNFFLGQWRGQLGCDVAPGVQVGLLGMLDGHDDTGRFGNTSVTLTPISQLAAYCRYQWPSGGAVRGWIGVADGHSEANVALGDLPRDESMLVWGSDLNVPLTCYLSLVGQANFITPADTGTVDAFLGFEYYPGGGAGSMRGARPLLPVASNASFSVDMHR